MKVHYLEIVSRDMDAVCKAYELAHSVSFSEPDEYLGGAKIPGKGKFAIYILGSNDHGLWQL